MRVAVAYVVSTDTEFFQSSIDSFRPAGDVFAFISKKSGAGESSDSELAVELAQRNGVATIVGEWEDVVSHRRFAQDYICARGYNYLFTPESDEIIDGGLLQTLIQIATLGLAERVYVDVDTYWKSAEFVIRPRERSTTLIFINPSAVAQCSDRGYEGGRPLVVGADYGLLHRMSYAGVESLACERIALGTTTRDMIPQWVERVWKQWDSDPTMVNLHPIEPELFGWAERIEVPDTLKNLDPGKPRQAIDAALDQVSVVIPVYGAAEELNRCLKTLESYASKLREVIVVDNASPDHAREIAKSFEFVTLIENRENYGFAKACNLGLAASTGSQILFLNSDAFVPEIALRAMVASLERSGIIGAIGPYTNNVGHWQRTRVTYTGIDGYELFADMFAGLDRDDTETNMLVGFCLLVRKSVLEEIGSFDERFLIGMYEDNDLCYRMLRAGYKMLICGRAFVHHIGSKSFEAHVLNPTLLSDHNGAMFR